MKREFKGVWIPKDLYLDKGLTWAEKLILLEVDSFTANGLTCFVSNEHLAHFTQSSLSTVEKAISRLVKEGYLERQRQKVDGKSTRFLRVISSNFCEKAPVNFAENKPYFLRPTNTNILNQTKKPKKERTPVNVTVCIEAFEDAGSNSIEANKFYDYYSANGWTQGKNKPIVDWRAAARNWIRRAKEYEANNKANGFNAARIDATRLASYIADGNT